MNRCTTALVTIDMQAAFFESGLLAPLVDDLVARCNELHHWAASHDIPVIEVRTQHRRDRSTWTLNMLEDDMGFLLEGDDDAQPVPGLVTDGAIELVKTRDSAFHRTDLADQLRELGVGLLVLAGVSTHTCVASTATDAYAHDLHVVLVEDAIASSRPDLHAVTLATLCDEFRFRCLSTADVVAGSESELAERPD